MSARFAIGARVRALGQIGTITAIGFSRATDRTIYTVAFDPRIRLTVRDCDVEAA